MQLRPNRSNPKCENRFGFQIGCHVRTWAVFTVVVPVFSQSMRTAQHCFQPLVSVFFLFQNQRTVGFYETLQNFIYKHTIHLENVQMNKKKENLQDVKLVQTRCEETYWLICIDTQIPQLLKGGTNQWGVDWFDLYWFFTNHHNIRIVVPIISKTLKNQQSGESTQKLEPNNTSLNQCYVSIRICYRYLLIITWVYMHSPSRGEKKI